MVTLKLLQLSNKKVGKDVHYFTVFNVEIEYLKVSWIVVCLIDLNLCP